MQISNIFLVGIFVSFILIFLYSYWGYTIYRYSSTRIGIRATSKYSKEMVESNPLYSEYEARKAQVVVSPDKTTATVKFNIWDKSNPPIPISGAIRKYNISPDQESCLSGSTPLKKYICIFAY